MRLKDLPKAYNDPICHLIETEVRAIVVLEISRTFNGQPGLIQHMRIDHGGRNIRMPQKLLYGAYIVSALQQMSRKRVSEGVAVDPFGYSGLFCRGFYGLLYGIFVQVMSSDQTASGINR